MSEKILSIMASSRPDTDGFTVHTNEQTIELTIDNGACCCESWGHFWCNDEPDEFVGASLMGVELVSDALSTKILEKNGAHERYEGGIMFVNLNTDRGVLQFVAYNSHNGYYGHEATVTSKQLTHSETL